MNRFIGIIPARYQSSRFPGKPLIDILGKSMIQRVYERIHGILDKVYIATDDQRIAQAVENFGGNFIMTSIEHENGTSRCNEAAKKIQDINSDDIIINIQGDEPIIAKESIYDIKKCFMQRENTSFVTLVNKVEDVKIFENEGEVFVVFDRDNNALYFSRAVIPYVNGVPDKSQWLTHHTYYKHVGIYAYRMNALEQFVKMPISPLEQIESLEQNRWLENGGKIKISISNYDSMPVDTPKDLDRLIDYMKSNNIE